MSDHEPSTEQGEAPPQDDLPNQGNDDQGTPSGGPVTGSGGRSVAARSSYSRDSADRAQRPTDDE